MSREVEVKNIQVTATVPEDIQISLGEIKEHNKSTNLAMNTGYLSTSGSVVKEPSADFDWSNTADISKYYSFGKLIPASSVDGTDIFFTPDANGVGKTVKSNGMFYTAASGKDAQAESTVGSGTGKLNATAHVYDNEAPGTWTGSGATTWNVTYDDGYYIDIPVWLRTSSNSVSLGVQAYVTDAADPLAANPSGAVTNSGTQEGELLYRAVRTALLDKDGNTLTDLIPIADGSSGATAEKYGGTNIINYYNRSGSSAPDTNENHGQAVATEGSGSSVYGAPVYYASGTGTPTRVFDTIGSGTGVDYGPATQYIIRVWLEGEDPDCWNETAGQDWSINLKFVKIN